MSDQITLPEAIELIKQANEVLNDPAKANPLEYAQKARKYIKEKAHI